MTISANNPSLKSWVDVPTNSDFPIQNLPFGIFKTAHSKERVGVRIGDYVLDLCAIFDLGLFANLGFERSDFEATVLNPMMKKGKLGVRALRNKISDLLEVSSTLLQENRSTVLFPIDASVQRAINSKTTTTSHLNLKSFSNYTAFYTSLISSGRDKRPSSSSTKAYPNL
jgi:fumarylacetoacetase